MSCLWKKKSELWNKVTITFLYFSILLRKQSSVLKSGGFWLAVDVSHRMRMIIKIVLLQLSSSVWTDLKTLFLKKIYSDSEFKCCRIKKVITTFYLTIISLYLTYFDTPHKNYPWFYYCSKRVTMFFWHIDCNLYNHSLTTHTMFKLCFVYSKAMVNLWGFFYDKTECYPHLVWTLI